MNISAPVLLALRVVLALVLYGFLALALNLTWKNLRATSQRLAVPQFPRLALLPADTEAEPGYYNTQIVLVGRDPASDLHLDDPTISAHHARISFHHGQWWLEDLHSRNGTLLNQEAVSEPVVITGGDSLRCGQVELRIVIEQAH
ncbi:MAG TPA: FHA domain-containing protein [Anaerolineales bacterium]|nr:FHA domain-containing protein [Anaerolineales bacterium]